VAKASKSTLISLRLIRQCVFHLCVIRLSVKRSTVRSGKSFSDKTAAVFNVDGQSGRQLSQYLSSIADRCVARCSAGDDNHVDGDGDGNDDDDDEELPLVIVLDGLQRITTTPLADIFAALLNVELCSRSTAYIQFGSVRGGRHRSHDHVDKFC